MLVVYFLSLDELCVLCVVNSYDIVCVVESWLSNDKVTLFLEKIEIDMVGGLLFL